MNMSAHPYNNRGEELLCMGDLCTETKPWFSTVNINFVVVVA
jgi:hypothetical protein